MQERPEQSPPERLKLLGPGEPTPPPYSIVESLQFACLLMQFAFDQAFFASGSGARSGEWMTLMP